jgi:hypothetical protein
MATSQSGSESSRVGIERATETIEDRLPEGAFVVSYESLGHIQATVSMGDVTGTAGNCCIVSGSDSPVGWEIKEVSIHADTESMMVTFAEESR